MFESIIAIIAGVTLLAGSILKNSPAGKRLTSIFLPFQSVTGLVALVVGILNFSNIIGIALIIAGLIMAADALSEIPGIGDALKRAGQALRGIGGLVGAILLVLAVYRLI